MRYCLLPIAYCLLVFSSCKQKTDYSKEIAQLDSAGIKLKETGKYFLSVDTASLLASYAAAQAQLHAIGEKISKDTLKKKTAMFLSDCYEQTGNILNLVENKKYLERAIMEGQQRISDLKHDLKEDLIEKNKSREYIVNELNVSRKIYETANKAIEKAKTSAAKLDSMKTQIEFLSDSLQSK